jgi:hypothetical protein
LKGVVVELTGAKARVFNSILNAALEGPLFHGGGQIRTGMYVRLRGRKRARRPLHMGWGLLCARLPCC